MECPIVRIKILSPSSRPSAWREVYCSFGVLSQPLYLFSAYPIAQNRKKSFAVMEGRRSLIDSEPSPGQTPSNKLSNVLCGNIFKELFSCLRPHIPIMFAKDLAGSMLRRQVFFDEAVICSGFEHLDTFFDSINQPLDKLRNLIRESGRLSAFVLNDDIFVAEHDCPVSLVFELNGLQLIPT